ncbi:glycosyltransferase involved in cell wall biosynthesis [Arcanobacterium wilhelmae]|uniref:Glycosyltransferase involved in cell wall biosynthesis n=1 Tax=Arcanobacterium wilhelmae TaxID=1803177 RepID=A0ABT9NDC3_9ACTO|nr:glycosyltransferase family 2 protein [Arcanobacterium wilhelmae]MDP9801714.1 glycosyltransferase involved in cell wall biosynthesis [Arcanobacterium wilhelmae]WFN91033.1 glycosyltransferase family 2 protein [Arcanobacterium wilhelmae]
MVVLVPCYNEAGGIANVVEGLRRSGYDYLVINDCSTDNSAQILRSVGANFLDLPNNLGIGGAMQTGYRWAQRHGYDVAIQFDGDGQHRTDEIDKIVGPILAGEADFVVGSRFVGDAKGAGFQSTWLRRVGIKTISSVTKFLTRGKTILDSTSGFRAANSEIIQQFADRYPSEYPEPLTNLAVLKSRLRTLEVPVTMNEREFGESSIGGLSSVYYMLNVVIQLFLVSRFPQEDF